MTMYVDCVDPAMSWSPEKIRNESFSNRFQHRLLNMDQVLGGYLYTRQINQKFNSYLISMFIYLYCTTNVLIAELYRIIYNMRASQYTQVTVKWILYFSYHLSLMGRLTSFGENTSFQSSPLYFTNFFKRPCVIRDHNLSWRKGQSLKTGFTES